MTILYSKTGVEIRLKNAKEASLFGPVKKCEGKRTDRRHNEL